MPGGIVAKNDFADHALVFGEMSFFDEMIGAVIFILSEETKLFLRTQDFGVGEAPVFIKIVTNFFEQLAILARGSGNGFVTGGIAFVNRARAIGVEDDADADLAVAFLREGTERSGRKADEEGKGEAAHDVLVGGGKVEGKVREEKARLRRAKGGSAAPSGDARYERLRRQIDDIEVRAGLARLLDLSPSCVRW
jgi:hypothetical protein